MPFSRRELLQGATMLAAGSMGISSLLAADGQGLYDRSIVIDGLGFPGRLDSGGKPLDAAALADIRNSGLTALHMTIGDVGTMPPLEAFEHAARSITHWESEIAAHPELFASIRNATDIFTAKANGQTGLIYGLQDGVAFEDDPGRIEALHYLGVRVIQPTYNRRNLLGDGCMEPADAGLSRAGKQAIELIQSLGITLDLSHCGRRTTAEALAMASRPVSFTHTGCNALVEHPRHRTDAEMRAAADSGGIVGIYIMPYLAKGAQPTAEDVMKHLDHAINAAGEDHVSLGTDGNVSPTVVTDAFRKQFRAITLDRKARGIAAPHETEEGYLFANDLNTPRRLETLAGLLLARGHSEARVEKILGTNLVRVYTDTWSTPS